MSKITPDHLARGAYVYVRQSTPDQLLHNPESRRRQYALAERARQLGWTEVVVIDDDLGRSGGGVSRPGFERLLLAICEGRVGAVLAVEASRLARNGRDWHTLLEFCALVGCLLIDEEGQYDPRLANDRLLLGMKGTLSEMELSILRQRSLEALRQKAKRGELFLTVAVGYVKTRHDRIDLDPDRRVREAIAGVFQADAGGREPPLAEGVIVPRQRSRRREAAAGGPSIPPAAAAAVLRRGHQQVGHRQPDQEQAEDVAVADACREDHHGGNRDDADRRAEVRLQIDQPDDRAEDHAVSRQHSHALADRNCQVPATDLLESQQPLLVDARDDLWGVRLSAYTGTYVTPPLSISREKFGEPKKLCEIEMVRDGNHVEGRIAFLQTEIGITDAQREQWNTFAVALRGNADVLRRATAAFVVLGRTRMSRSPVARG